MKCIRDMLCTWLKHPQRVLGLLLLCICGLVLQVQGQVVPELQWDKSSGVWSGDIFVTTYGDEFFMQVITNSDAEVQLLYNGVAEAPTAAGTYTVVCKLAATASYQAASISGTLVINRAKPFFVWNKTNGTWTVNTSRVVYNGSPQGVTHITDGDGDVTITYSGANTPPTNAGAYTLVGELTQGANYLGSKISGALIIEKAIPILEWDKTQSAPYWSNDTLRIKYQGTPFPTPVITNSDGEITVTYNGSAEPPINTGTYRMSASITAGTNYVATSIAAVLIIEKGIPQLDWNRGEGNWTVDTLRVVYNGQPQPAKATTDSDGELSITYNGSATPPTDVGVYVLQANVSETFNFNPASIAGVLIIEPAQPTLAWNQAVGSWRVDTVRMVYDGNPKTAQALSNSPGVITVTYNGSITPPVDVGVYVIKAELTPTQNYKGTTITGVLIIEPAIPILEWDKQQGTWQGDTLHVLYDGNPHQAKVITNNDGALTITYNGSTVAPVDVGTYILKATVTAGSNYNGGTIVGVLIIAKAPPVLAWDTSDGTWSNDTTRVLYDGTPHAVSVVTNSDGAVTITYNGSTTPPTQAGIYPIEAKQEAGTNYQAALIRGILIIAKATPDLYWDKSTGNWSIDTIRVVYDGTPKSVGALSNSTGSITVIYNGSASPPVNAGSYVITAVLAEGVNHMPAIITGVLIIEKAPPILEWDKSSGNWAGDTLRVVYNGSPHTVNATSTSNGIITITYNGLPIGPTDVGMYVLQATLTEGENYLAGTIVGVLIIEQAPPVLEWDKASGGSWQGDTIRVIYDGNAHPVTAWSNSNGVIAVTYNGLPTPPTNVGVYLLHAQLTQGSNYLAAYITGVLIIEPALPLFDWDRSVGSWLVDTVRVVYSGSPHAVATISNSNGVVTVTYNGLLAPPTNVGVYNLQATLAPGSNYQGAVITGVLIVERAPLTLQWDKGQTGTWQVDTLRVLYNGAPHPVFVLTNSNGALTITYNGAAQPPVDAGVYVIKAEQLAGSNYLPGSIVGVLIVEKSPPLLQWDNTIGMWIADTTWIPYDGNTHQVGVITNSAGVVTITYNGSLTPPSATGNYIIVATLVESNNHLAASISGMLVIGKMPPSLLWDKAVGTWVGDTIRVPYDGNPHPVSAITNSDGVLTITYDGSPEPPVDAGVYIIKAQVAPGTDYAATSIVGVLIIERVAPVLAWNKADGSWQGDTTIVEYNGNLYAVSVLTNSTGVVTITYNGSTTPPTNAGTYLLRAEVQQGHNHVEAFIVGVLIITKADPVLAWNTSDGTWQADTTRVVYNGNPHTVSVITNSGGTVTITYNGSTQPPTQAGSYILKALLSEGANYAADSIVGVLIIDKAHPVLEWDKATGAWSYDTIRLEYAGMPHTVSAISSSPAPITITYNGSINAPIEIGEYALRAEQIDENNYHSTYVVGVLIITRAMPALEWVKTNGTWSGDTTRVPFDGQSHSVQAISNSNGTITITYNGSSTAPTQAGTYSIRADQTEGDNYSASYIIGVLIIEKTTPMLAWVKDITWSADTTRVVYDGSTQPVFAVTNSDGVLTITYNGAVVAPTDVGVYTLQATLAPGTNHAAYSIVGVLIIEKAPPVLAWNTSDGGWTVDTLRVVYDGNPHSVSVITDSNGKVVVTYSGSVLAPTQSGSYVLKAVLSEGANHLADSIGGLLIIERAQPVFEWDKSYGQWNVDTIRVAYNGNPHPVAILTNSAGQVSITYNGDAQPPIGVGTYVLKAVLSEGANHLPDSIAGLLIVEPGIPVLEWDTSGGGWSGDTLRVVYDGNIHPVSVYTNSDGIVTITYNTSTNAPSQIGVYALRAQLSQGTNYESGSIIGWLIIERAQPLLAWNKADGSWIVDTSRVPYDGNVHTASVITNSDGAVVITYNGAVVAATSEVGVYALRADLGPGTNHAPASIQGQLEVLRVAPVLTWDTSDGTWQNDTTTVDYNGSPHAVAIITNSNGQVSITYNGVEQAPVEAGTYIIKAVVQEGSNHLSQSIVGVLIIGKVPPQLAWDNTVGAWQADTVRITYNGNAHTVGVLTNSNGAVAITYNGTVDAPANAGTYVLKAELTPGDNHLSATIGGVLIIEPAAPILQWNKAEGAWLLDTVTLAYSAAPHVLSVITNSTGVVTIRYNGALAAPTNVGEYLIEATLAAGSNHQGATISGKLIITKARPILEWNTTVGSWLADSVYMVYTGTPRQVQVVTNSDAVVTITYNSTTNAPVQLGVYAIKAVVPETPNYWADSIVGGLVVGRDAPYLKWDKTDRMWKGDTLHVVYDGTKHSVTALTNSDGLLSITYNGTVLLPVDAGIYTIKAHVASGTGYTQMTIVGQLVVHKATPIFQWDTTIGSWSADTLTVYYGELYTVSVTTNITAPYAITYDGQQAAPINGGVYRLRAVQDSTGNYASVTIHGVLIIVADDMNNARISDLDINNHHIDPNDYLLYRYEIPCDLSEDIVRVFIRFQIARGATANRPQEGYWITTNKPGVYYDTIMVTSPDKTVEQPHYVEVYKSFPGNSKVKLQKGNATLIINNNPNTNGGYSFVSYEWFRNGMSIATGQNYYASLDGSISLDSSASYTAMLVTIQGKTIYTCPYIPSLASVEVKAYPNPLRVGEELNIEMSNTQELREPFIVVVTVYTTNGLLLRRDERRGFRFTIALPYMPHSYIVNLRSPDGRLNKTVIVNVN